VKGTVAHLAICNKGAERMGTDAEGPASLNLVALPSQLATTHSTHVPGLPTPCPRLSAAPSIQTTHLFLPRYTGMREWPVMRMACIVRSSSLSSSDSMNTCAAQRQLDLLSRRPLSFGSSELLQVGRGADFCRQISAESRGEGMLG